MTFQGTLLNYIITLFTLTGISVSHISLLTVSIVQMHLKTKVMHSLMWLNTFFFMWLLFVTDS